MKKKTDGGHEIPEEDLREMEQDGGQEVPEGAKTQTGYCRFCGQAGIIHALEEWSQAEVDEAATCKCECDEAKKYAESKERVQKANHENKGYCGRCRRGGKPCICDGRRRNRV